MAKMTIEEFGTVEKLKIVKMCWVKGELKQAGDVVELSGNDKSQLLGAKQAVRLGSEFKEVEKSKK